MIRWTFYFEEGNVSSIVHNEEEDARISDWVADPIGLLFLPGDKFDMYINIDHVKAIVSEILKPEDLQPSQETEETQAAA